MFGSEEYVVINHRFADAVREAMGGHRAEKDIRAWLFRGMKNARYVGQKQTQLGTVGYYEFESPGIPGTCRVDLVWGIHPDGSPKMALDGKKVVVFADRLTVIPFAPPAIDS